MVSAASSNGWNFGFVRIGVADGCGFTGSGFVAAQCASAFASKLACT